MNNPTLVRLYAHLVETGSRIDVRAQYHMAQTLLDAKEFPLLAQLAGREDLCPRADALLAGCGDPRVLAAWAQRPGRSTNDLLRCLKNEKRVSTLLQLAKTPDLPEVVYAEIAGRGSTKLTKALLLNPSLGDAVKETHLTRFVEAIDAEDDHRKQPLLRNFGTGPALLARIVDRTDSPHTALLALTELRLRWPEQAPDAAKTCIERIDDLLPSGGPAYHYLEHELLELLAEHQLDHDQTRKLRATASRRSKKQGKTHRGLMAATNALLSDAGRKKLAQVDELATTDDVARAKTLIANLLTGVRKQGAFPYQQAVRALARNTRLPAKIVMPFMDDFTNEEEQTTILRWIEKGETAAAVEKALTAWCAPQWVDALDEPLELIRLVVSRAAETDSEIPDWVLEHPATLASPETALQLLPWKAVTALGYLHQMADEYEDAPWDATGASEHTTSDRSVVASAVAVIHAAHTLMVEKLGDDRHAWETFASLAEEFDGTLPDLLAAATSL